MNFIQIQLTTNKQIQIKNVKHTQNDYKVPSKTV